MYDTSPKSAKNNELDQRVVIDLQFGSDFQKETITSLLTTMLSAAKLSFESRHKKNKMEITST